MPTGLWIDLEFINFIFIERKAEGLNPLPKTFWRKPGSELQSVSSQVLIPQASRLINPFCCKHFTLLIIEIFDMREAIFTRLRQEGIGEFERRVKDLAEHHTHLDAVEEYERRTNRPSRIPGKPCEADEEKK